MRCLEPALLLIPHRAACGAACGAPHHHSHHCCRNQRPTCPSTGKRSVPASHTFCMLSHFWSPRWTRHGCPRYLSIMRYGCRRWSQQQHHKVSRCKGQHLWLCQGGSGPWGAGHVPCLVLDLQPWPLVVRRGQKQALLGYRPCPCSCLGAAPAMGFPSGAQLARVNSTVLDLCLHLLVVVVVVAAAAADWLALRWRSCSQHVVSNSADPLQWASSAGADICAPPFVPPPPWHSLMAVCSTLLVSCPITHLMCSTCPTQA